MNSLRRFLTRLLGLTWQKRQHEDRLQQEIEEHLALETEENLRVGMPEIEARRQAILKFGGVETIKESYRAERGLPFLETLLQDLRYALSHTSQKSRASPHVAILTLALGIGAALANLFPLWMPSCSALFPIPIHKKSYAYGNRLRTVTESNLAGPNFDDLLTQNDTFASLAKYGFGLSSVSGGTEPDAYQHRLRLQWLLQSPRRRACPRPRLRARRAAPARHAGSNRQLRLLAAISRRRNRPLQTPPQHGRRRLPRRRSHAEGV